MPTETQTQYSRIALEVRAPAARLVLNNPPLNVIDLAMMDVLWETQEISQFGMENEPGYGTIEVGLSGLASFYLRRREALRKKGR